MIERTIHLPTTTDMLERALLALAENHHELHAGSGESFRMSRFQQQGRGLWYMSGTYHATPDAPGQPLAVSRDDRNNGQVITLAIVGESAGRVTVLSKCVDHPLLLDYWRSLLDRLEALYATPEPAKARGPYGNTAGRVREFHKLLKRGATHSAASEQTGGLTTETYVKWCQVLTGEEPVLGARGRPRREKKPRRSKNTVKT